MINDEESDGSKSVQIINVNSDANAQGQRGDAVNEYELGNSDNQLD